MESGCFGLPGETVRHFIDFEKSVVYFQSQICSVTVRLESHNAPRTDLLTGRRELRSEQRFYTVRRSDLSKKLSWDRLDPSRSHDK